MKDILQVVLAVLAAFLLYSLLGTVSPQLVPAVNVFSLVVVAFSISRGEIFGACVGTACGLIQDSFSLGIFGLAGLTKTLLGFWTGYVSRRIDVASFPRKAVFILVMTSLELGGWVALKSFVFSERVVVGGLLPLQPMVTALTVSVYFQILRKLKGRAS